MNPFPFSRFFDAGAGAGGMAGGDSPRARPDGGKRRGPPRPVEVLRIVDLAPRVRRITFGGKALKGFGPVAPGAHIKVIFDGGAATWRPGSDSPRPPMRTYTPRHVDAERGEVDVDFVLHGGGLAGAWAERAQVGERLTLAGPGGGMAIPDGVRHAVLLADDTALPAAGMILDALPADCHVTLVAEVESLDDERTLAAREPDVLHWLHRRPAGARPGGLLKAAWPTLNVEPGALWWVATESMAVRELRTTLLRTPGIERDRLVTRGYWQMGESNHTDHDHGE